MLGGVFPLVTVQMFKAMTFPGASSFLGGVVSILKGCLWRRLTFNLGSVAYRCTLGSGFLWTKDPSQKQIRQCTYFVWPHRLDCSKALIADSKYLGIGMNARCLVQGAFLPAFLNLREQHCVL